MSLKSPALAGSLPLVPPGKPKYLRDTLKNNNKQTERKNSWRVGGGTSQIDPDSPGRWVCVLRGGFAGDTVLCSLGPRRSPGTSKTLWLCQLC